MTMNYSRELESYIEKFRHTFSQKKFEDFELVERVYFLSAVITIANGLFEKLTRQISKKILPNKDEHSNISILKCGKFFKKNLENKITSYLQLDPNRAFFGRVREYVSLEIDIIGACKPLYDIRCGIVHAAIEGNKQIDEMTDIDCIFLELGVNGVVEILEKLKFIIYILENLDLTNNE